MVATLSTLFSARSRTAADPPPADPERDRLVSDIRTLNPTATRGFLAEFRPAALRLYLAHLAATHDEPRGRRAVWVRPADTPAIVTRAARE